MEKIRFKNLSEHLIIIGIFLVISFIFCLPQLDNKVLFQSDKNQYLGMSKEKADFEKKTGEVALWTNSAFGGMPTFLISNSQKTYIIQKIHNVLNIFHKRPAAHIFLFLIGFYVCALSFTSNLKLSAVGAIAYAFSSYFFIIISVGHISKVMALGYLPPMIGGFYLAFQDEKLDKKLLGSTVFGLSLALQLFVNHLQITYYTAIILLFFIVSLFIFSIKKNTIKNFFISSAFVSIMALIAIGVNFQSLWTTYEYGKFSTRSKSELKIDAQNQTSGLDKDYVTAWSYGIPETFTFLIPNFMGGASVSPLSESSKTFDFLTKVQGRAEAKKTIQQMPTYWGKQSSTSGPVYAGAIVCFLFILGLFLVENKYRWWILAATIVSFVLAWGKNVPHITNFLLDYLPGYNKFRAVSITLIIAEFTIPLLALLALDRIIKGNITKKEILNGLKYSTAIVGGLILFFILFAKALFNFEALTDSQYIAKGATDFVDSLQADRATMFRTDAWRSLFFILVAAALIFVFVKEKIKLLHFIVGLGLLILIDMWGVGKRYLNEDNFMPKQKQKTLFTESVADQIILQDPEQDYRVLNASVDIFNEATTSYFHKSLGGYSGAKMKRYQELIEFRIQPEIQQLFADLNKGTDINKAFEQCPTLNMLNTKYLIYSPDKAPVLNQKALGSVWFAKEIVWAKDANEEMDLIGKIKVDSQVVIDQRYKGALEGFTPTVNDSIAFIRLKEYSPNRLIYESSSKSDQLAVFSEIYYPKGWIVTVDGAEVEYIRSNYLLRALKIPKGNHTIEFNFKPQSYYLGEKISKASSVLLLLLFIGSIIYPFYTSKTSKKADA